MTAAVDPGLGEQRPYKLSLYYNGAFESPATIDPSTGDVQLRLGEIVDALVIRAGFAAEVNNFLVRHMMRAPIIVTPGEHVNWIFLTQPRTTMRQSVWEHMVRIQVGWKLGGETIALPPLGSAGNRLRWLEPPHRGAGLPPWTAVVCAARSALTCCGTW